MIEENIIVVAKKKSKQGVYKDPEKRKKYKALHAKNTALEKKNKKVVQSVEHNQSFLVIEFNKLNKFSKEHDFKDIIKWMGSIQHVNNEILKINEQNIQNYLKKKNICYFFCKHCGIRVKKRVVIFGIKLMCDNCIGCDHIRKRKPSRLFQMRIKS